MDAENKTAGPVAPGECLPWTVKAQELPPLKGDAELVERVWNDLDGLAYTYIWQVLLSF